MSSALFIWGVALVWISIVDFGATMAGLPKQTIDNDLNEGLLDSNDNDEVNCGVCPEGKKREPSNERYCGRCVPVSEPCANGYNLMDGECHACHCPGTGDRQFATSCTLDLDGQVTCDCLSEYIGRDCSQCAPGTVQNNQPPYNCVRLNRTTKSVDIIYRSEISPSDGNEGNPTDLCPRAQPLHPPHHHHLQCPSSTHIHHDHHHHYHYAAQSPQIFCPPCICPGQPKVVRQNEERPASTSSSLSFVKPFYPVFFYFCWMLKLWKI